jgi:acyl carrier protein
MNQRVKQVVAEVLGLEADAVGDDLSRDSADSWDSLNHLRIVTALEQEFAITLSMEEIQGAQSVRQLIGLVARLSGNT